MSAAAIEMMLWLLLAGVALITGLAAIVITLDDVKRDRLRHDRGQP